MPGLKHLIECHCYLAIYKSSQKIVNHKFPVYSKIDEIGNVIPKLVKCNNCEAVHYVDKICRSELRPGKDQTLAIMSIEDIVLSMPNKISNYLITNNCDISVCQSSLKNKIVIFSAIDNLIKGAAGQAVQNMNVLFKFKETLGLKWNTLQFYC